METPELFFSKDGTLSSPVAENNLLREKLISYYESNEKKTARVSTPPTTPSTIGCNSSDELFDTPDGSMVHEESEIEESITDSPILRQLETSPGKPSNHPLVTAVSARAVLPHTAFELLTREVTPDPEFLEPDKSETVNQIIAGMMPSPKSSKKSVRDLVNLSKSFQDKMAGLMEFGEEIEQGIQHTLSLSESLATCIEKAPAEEESSEPRNVHLGVKDDVLVFLHTTGVVNHMLEKDTSIACFSTADDWSTGVKVSLIPATDDVTMDEPEELMVNVDHPKFPGPADRNALAISEMVYKREEERRNIIADGGELCADSKAGHIAVDALNESGRKAEISPCRFIHFDDVGVSSCPFMQSISSDDCTDPWANSEFEMSEVKGTSVDSDSVSDFSDFMADCYWDREEEESRGPHSTKTPFSKDIKHMLSDLGVMSAKVKKEIVQIFNCSGPSPYPDENAIGKSCMSPCHRVIDKTISRNDDYFWVSDYLSAQDDFDDGSIHDDDSRTVNSRTLSLDSSNR
jgi:hypothetical protein